MFYKVLQAQVKQWSKSQEIRYSKNKEFTPKVVRQFMKKKQIKILQLKKF